MSKITSYKGDRPYIFISYAHKDSLAVYPILARMQKDGYRIWYDEGIEPGSEWDEMIAEKVNCCEYFLGFMSENYLSSSNCKDELSFARDLEKKRILIFIEDVNLPLGMAMRMNRIQSIPKHKYTDEDAFYRELYSADGMRALTDAVEKPLAFTAKQAANLNTQANVCVPEGVERIGGYAFSGCEGIRRVSLPQTLLRIEDYAFAGCKELEALELFPQLSYIGAYAFSGCRSLTDLHLPSSVLQISEYAFRGCTGLERVLLPPGLQRIESYTFWKCIRLSEINIPQGVEELDNGAFSLCRGLKQVHIPEGVTRIGKHAFSWCTALTRINLKEELTVLDDYAFTRCEQLQHITLPKSLRRIGADALSYTALTDVYYAGTAAEWRQIQKDPSFDDSTPAYTVFCSDGNVKK